MSLTARVYVDTSVLVAAFSNEPQQALAMALLQAPQWEQVCVSDWTMAEFACAMHAKMLRGEASAALVHTLQLKVKSLLKQGALLRLPVWRDDFSAIERTAATSVGLVRGADALHLAVAARSNVSHFATLDNTQRAAASQWLVGIDCVPVL